LELTNGITLEVRPASFPARRFRDLVNAFVADMGGLDRCSQIKLGLVRRLAATTVQAEMLEARMVNGEAIDIATLCTLASTTVRISQRLGLERRARNVTPSLGQYLAARTAPATGDTPSMDATAGRADASRSGTRGIIRSRPHPSIRRAISPSVRYSRARTSALRLRRGGLRRSPTVPITAVGATSVRCGFVMIFQGSSSATVPNTAQGDKRRFNGHNCNFGCRGRTGRHARDVELAGVL
jgi:hypothetical protein